MSYRPPASSESVRSRMSEQRRRDTAAELRVRRRLHARSVRFRVDVKPESDLRAKGDIVWRGLKLIVFIDGCFWHGCPEHATRPRANAEWWAEKLDNNVRRDRRTDADLSDRDWHVLRFWEHEDPNEVADVICAKLDELRSAGRSQRFSSRAPEAQRRGR
ncbi:very short patch repair endonuclease [Gordonia hankookensis]|uniref:DNA mismatch endonuclease Vsr n=1 Tax=Gordonia hankookensis TaxID=589403 RepID=A0ABR7WCQ2_9ACTN|nr:DNA mismatch endonuclease Vsr [Gordonia hankookensis]MBD1320573.1 DNA mismatch endonuclease Vsr [Gordonia hankookensis]